MEDERGRTKEKSRTPKPETKRRVNLPIRAEICYPNLNKASQLLKFTNRNLLFYLPNLDDDTPEPILEDDLQTDEQLRRKSTQHAAPLPHARFYPSQETTCKLQRCLSIL